MDSEHWRRVDRVFQAALEIDPNERAAFLDQKCTGDDSLRREVESLLDYDRQGLSLIDAPVLDMVANLLGTHAPELSVGQHIGHYKILNLLGAGGMGEVYLAHDTSLGRKIALKLLPADFTIDDERVRRFQQEARAASALNHPNILTIYEIGQFDDRRFMATEFIEGRTLRQLARGSKLGLSQALDMASQIAGALAAAHQAGIVHRDIKPENIMLRPDGYVKVLDFGLAKLTEQELSTADTETRTVEQLDTLPGMVLGTAKYMSPEQARGLRVDGRSDIFSLGVLLYEMAAGRAPFEGETTSDLIASILKVDPPPLTEYSPDAPSELQRIVSKALSKDKEDRYQAVGDMLVDLRGLRQELELESKIQRALQPGGDSGTSVTTSPTRLAVQTADELALSTGSARAARTLASARYLLSRVTRNKASATLTFLISLIVVLGIGYGAYKLVGLGKPSHFRNIKMSRVTTSGRASGAAISPDGRYVAYTEWEGDQQKLWLRQVATSSTVQVASSITIGGKVTFSPDGNYLYCVALTQTDPEPAIYRMPALGGVSQKLIAGVNSSVAISPDGKRLAFERDYPQGESAILVANADGSEERKLAVRQSPKFFLSAAWSPDGKKLACVGQGRDSEGFYGDVVELGLEGGEQRPITDRRWALIDEVVWLSDGSGLMMTASEKTDSSNLLWLISYPGGDSRRVTTDLSNYWALSVTKDSSILVTSLQERVSDTNLYIQTKDAGTPAKLTSGSARMDGWSGISWTPDGKIAYSSQASGNSEIWTMDPDGGNQKQLTVDLGSNTRGLSVSPDGRYIVVISNRAGGPQVWRVDIDGGNPKQLTHGSGAFNPFISPDGKWVFYHDGADVPRASKVSIDGGEPLGLTSPFSEIVPRGFSPDGKLLAYRPSGVPLGRKGIGIASAEDGKPIKSVDLPRNIQWTPDGQSITYADLRDGASNLWLLPLDGGPRKQLTHFKDKESQIVNFAWSRDGEYLVFNRSFQASDIVLINSVK